MRLIITVVCLFLASTALADKPRFGDTFSFSLGAISNKASGTFSSTNDGEPVSKLKLSDLNMGDATTKLWGDFSWQFAERWRVGVNYSAFDDKGSDVAEVSGNWDDIEWSAGATLDGKVGLKLYIVDINWDFLKTDNAHLGIGAGLHVADLDFRIGATGHLIIDGEEFDIDLGSEAVDVTAPLPNLNLSGGYMIGDSIYLSGSVGWFSLNYDKYDGSLTSLRANVEWRPFKSRNIGFGAAYQYIDLDLKVDQSTRKDRYNIDFQGPVLFISAGF